MPFTSTTPIASLSVYFDIITKLAKYINVTSDEDEEQTGFVSIDSGNNVETGSAILTALITHWDANSNSFVDRNGDAITVTTGGTSFIPGSSTDLADLPAGFYHPFDEEVITEAAGMSQDDADDRYLRQSEHLGEFDTAAAQSAARFSIRANPTSVVSSLPTTELWDGRQVIVKVDTSDFSNVYDSDGNSLASVKAGDVLSWDATDLRWERLGSLGTGFDDADAVFDALVDSAFTPSESGKESFRDKVGSVDRNLEDLADDLTDTEKESIQEKLGIDLYAGAAAEQIVDGEEVHWGINPGNIALAGDGQFTMSRALTADDDQKLFMGSVRYDNPAHDDAGRTYDRVPLPPINASRLRALYNRPTKERTSETQSFEPLDSMAAAIRFVLPRVGHEVESDLIEIVSLLYSGEHMTYVNGEVSASGTSIVVDDASGISVGDILIVHGTNGTNNFTEFIEVTAISSNTLTVTRNQAGTYVNAGVRTILDNEPIYKHDMRTFFGVSSNTATGEWEDFDGYLLSYGDDSYGIESTELDGNTLKLTRRDGSELEQDLSPIVYVPDDEGVSPISGQLVDVTLWIEVAEGTTPADPDVSYRWDTGWRNGAGTGTAAWGNWRTSKSAADTAGSGGVFWTARRQFQRSLSGGVWTYTAANSWTKMVEFDTEYSEDASSWHDTQTDDDRYIRMRDDNGEWVTWTIGDMTDLGWEVVHDWMNAYASSTGSVVQQNGTFDLSVYDELRIDVVPFDTWSSGVMLGRGAMLSDIIRKDDRGFLTTSNGVNSNDWLQWQDYVIYYNGDAGYVRVWPRWKDDSDYDISRPNHQREDDGTPINTSFMMRFRRDQNNDDSNVTGFWFFAFQAAYDRVRVRIMGRRGL